MVAMVRARRHPGLVCSASSKNMSVFAGSASIPARRVSSAVPQSKADSEACDGARTHPIKNPDRKEVANFMRNSGEVERVVRIELTWPAWKAGALPLSYTRVRNNFPNFIKLSIKF